MKSYSNKDRRYLADIIELQATNPPQNSFSRDEAEEPESTLSKWLRGYCKDQGWPALIFPQTEDVRNFLPPGWPDAEIILHNKTIYMELKRPKSGRKSDKQKEMAIRFLHLGHRIHEVKTRKKAMEILHGNEKRITRTGIQ